MRTRITLACTECKQRNYSTTKDKKVMPDRMEDIIGINHIAGGIFDVP